MINLGTTRKFDDAQKYRDRQRRIAIKNNSPSNWSKYKTLRNKVNNLKTFAKRRFFTNIENKI